MGLTDAALEEALRAVLAAPAHGVKVILTTRVAPQSLHAGAARGPGPPRPRRGSALSPCRDAPAREGPGRPPGDQETRRTSLLADARERTRGFPRALEALAGILAADREHDAGRAARRHRAGCPTTWSKRSSARRSTVSTRSPKQVMQALAIYPFPVPPVAVDYLPCSSIPAGDRQHADARPPGQHAVRPPRRRTLLPASGRPRLRVAAPADRRAQRSSRRAAAVDGIRVARACCRLLPADPHPS